jgi:hypothetical protein
MQQLHLFSCRAEAINVAFLAPLSMHRSYFAYVSAMRLMNLAKPDVNHVS